MSNKISFFTPVCDSLWKKKSFAIGKFGEWFFQGNLKKIYQIRTDALRSKEGIEVLLKEQDGQKNAKIRFVLSITVLPVIAALIDKTIFRLTHPNLHRNPLPDQWRNHEIVMVDKKRISNGFSNEVYLPDVTMRKVGSVFLHVYQQHSWSNPTFLPVEIDMDGKITTSTLPESIKETDDPDLILANYLKKKPNLVLAKTIQCDHSLLLKDNPYYRGIFQSTHDFNQKNHIGPSFYYSLREECFVLFVKKTHFAFNETLNPIFLKDVIQKLSDKAQIQSTIEKIQEVAKKLLLKNLK